MSAHPFPSNDSGYETSSYYSSSSPSLSSNGQASRLHHPLQQVPMSVMSGHHLDSSPVSPPVYHRSQHYHQPQLQHVVESGYQYNDFSSIAENPEEEELLDAIAKWQEQGDD
jgi:hypothetical protein